VSDLRLWTPGLATHDGATIDAPALTFAPAVIDRLDPDTSVAILLSVEISPDAEPGTYHGMLLVRGVPDCKFPLTLNVVGQGEP
jgi:hypothetical protein